MEEKPRVDWQEEGVTTLESELQKRKWIRKDFSQVGWGLLSMLLGTQILGSLVMVGVKAIFPDFAQTHWYTWTTLMVPLYGIGLPLFLLVTRRLSLEPPKHQYKISAGTWFKLLVVCWGLTYLFNFISVALNGVLSALKGDAVKNPLENLTNLPLLWTVLFTGILGPVLEEWVFRGILIAKLRRYGERACVFVSAFTFALFHGNLSQLLYAFALGAVFAYVTVKTGRLRYSMALHIAINLTGMVLLPKLTELGTMGQMAAGVFLIIVIGAGLFLLLDHRRQIGFAPGKIPMNKGSLDLVLGNPGMIAYMAFCLLSIISAILV